MADIWLHLRLLHQVGAAHRKLMLERLGLPLENDFATFRWLGNTGSAALPATMAIGLQHGFVTPDQVMALLGIGSGINCVMAAVRWQKSLIEGSGCDPAEIEAEWPLVQS